MTPYKIDIQQGNVVTQEMVQKLEPGMSRSQVRFLLGTPLITDPFHGDRWDYVYLYQKGGQAAEKRRLIVIFKDDKFVRTEGDPMPPGPAAKEPVGTSAKPAEASQPAAPTPDAKTASQAPPAAPAAGGAEPVKAESPP